MTLTEASEDEYLRHFFLENIKANPTTQALLLSLFIFLVIEFMSW